MSTADELMAVIRMYAKNPTPHSEFKVRAALTDFLSFADQEPNAMALQSNEQYRMQMAAISTAAIGYWEEGDSIHPDYDTVALRDVARLYAKYAAAASPARVAQPTEAKDFIIARLQGQYEERVRRGAVMEAALRTVMRIASESKEPASMADPESGAATRNGKFADISMAAAQGLGLTCGPPLDATTGAYDDALIAAVAHHAARICEEQANRFTDDRGRYVALECAAAIRNHSSAIDEVMPTFAQMQDHIAALRHLLREAVEYLTDAHPNGDSEFLQTCRAAIAKATSPA